MRFQNWVNGQFVDVQSEGFFSKLSPFDGEILGEVPFSSAFDFIQALQGAKKSNLAELSLDERFQILIKLASYLSAHAEGIALQEAQHQGLPQKFVLENSIEPAVALIKRIASGASLSDSSKAVFQPTGVISILCSWQLSLYLIIERLAPAIAAGNSALIKVSELSPITGLILAKALKEVGLPDGAVQILYGDQSLASLMVSHPGVNAVTAVGSQKTLESIIKQSTTTFKKLQLAGEAKNVSVILAGFDIEKNLDQILKSMLLGQGQLCWNSTKILLLENQSEIFFKVLAENLANVRPLLDPSGSELCTPLISLSSAESLKRSYALALQEQGRDVDWNFDCPNKGFFAKPKFIKDLTHCSVLHQEEVKAPLFLINTVKYQHEFNKWIQNSPLGHSTYLWGDTAKAQKVGSTLEVKNVVANHWSPRASGSVFGFKQSSYGISDINWNGSFYSNVKIMTVL